MTGPKGIKKDSAFGPEDVLIILLICKVRVTLCNLVNLILEAIWFAVNSARIKPKRLSNIDGIYRIISMKYFQLFDSLVINSPLIYVDGKAIALIHKTTNEPNNDRSRTFSITMPYILPS